MLSLVDTEFNESELLQYFIEKCVKVKTQPANKEPRFPMNVLAVDDGFVYHFDGAYAFATKGNMVRQLIVTDPRRFGLVMIDTKEVSKRNKNLIKKIESFVSTLTPLLAKLSSSKMITIEIKKGYTLSDVREQIIKDNAL